MFSTKTSFKYSHHCIFLWHRYLRLFFHSQGDIYSVDDYFSLNLKVVNCVFQVQKSPFTLINEAKPFHFIFLSAQLLLLSLQLYFPQSCNMMLTSGKAEKYLFFSTQTRDFFFPVDIKYQTGMTLYIFPPKHWLMNSSW